MRLDKYLKVSRLIKRRTVANDLASAGRVSVNGRVAKPGTDVRAGDMLEISFGQGTSTVRILKIADSARKEDAGDMYEIVSKPARPEDSPFEAE